MEESGFEIARLVLKIPAVLNMHITEIISPGGLFE